jgi:hypothetical protein
MFKTNQTKERMIKTHISDYSDSMYKVTDLYNHDGFIHWNKDKQYTGESMSNINPFNDSYKIYDLIDNEGFIYYEVYKMGLSKDKKELDNTNDILLLTTYNKDAVNRYMN